MSAKAAAVRHSRNAPDVDVGLCGARGNLSFVMGGGKLLTCPTCRAKRAAMAASRTNRQHDQLEARAQQLREMPNDFRRSPL